MNWLVRIQNFFNTTYCSDCAAVVRTPVRPEDLHLSIQSAGWLFVVLSSAIVAAAVMDNRNRPGEA